MAKVYMTCGRICSGKSTYAQTLRQKYSAVILSVDEITLALFGQDAGEKHDDYVAAAEKYLYRKSLEIIETGISVVLDWGFWTRAEREEARQFYGARGIAYEFHYLDIGEAEWHRRLEKRNAAVAAQQTDAYYVDDGLAAKFASIFEAPASDETDCRIISE
ncbi:MAG: ATP-binding protein [Oscillospiraceae bacterium]|nr:ATP-binding protein [Oscillospiraceae bacterium]MBQ5338431.1 ATP-binding protein [Oscillospiraceae bacterium]